MFADYWKPWSSNALARVFELRTICVAYALPYFLASASARVSAAMRFQCALST